MNLGDEIPDFEADTTVGKIRFHEWLGDSWGILFSHPSDFTPACTTKLAKVSQLLPEFAKRNVKVIALSCDSVDNYLDWMCNIKKFASDESDGFPYPIIEDPNRDLAVQFRMLDPVEKDSHGLPLTCRAVFVVDSKKKLRLSILYPATIGRDLDKILRAIDSSQLTEYNKVATLADWKYGEHCMILPTISEEEAQRLFSKGYTTFNVPSKKKYIRLTPHL